MREWWKWLLLPITLPLFLVIFAIEDMKRPKNVK